MKNQEAQKVSSLIPKLSQLNMMVISLAEDAQADGYIIPSDEEVDQLRVQLQEMYSLHKRVNNFG